MEPGKIPFFKTRYAMLLSAVFAIQAAGFYSLSRGERIPLTKPLAEVPRQLGNWGLLQEGVVEPEVRDELRADDLLSRQYVNPARNVAADLFVAYFRSQRQGQTPHSPQHCMPGSGWLPISTSIIPVSIPGRAEPIRINRYVITKETDKDVVLYWYQSSRRVSASEYVAKFYVIADALRYNRTDTALVRVVLPVGEHGNEDQATAAGIDFIQSFFTTLSSFFPA